MKFFTYLQVAVAFLIVASPVGAAQYVVDGANSAASDRNPGTAAHPFKTIQHAADIAMAGDTVLIRPGVYAESVIVRHSGTAQKPIVFQSTQWHGATIVAPNLQTMNLFEAGNKPPEGEPMAYYITLRGIVFGHTAFRGWSGQNDFPDAVGPVHGWSVEDCVVKDNMGVGFGNGITVDSNDSTFLRTIFEGGYVGGCGAGGNGPSHPLENVRFINCIFRRNNPKDVDTGDYIGANKYLFDHNFLMDGVISYDNNGSGTWFDTDATNFTIKNCTFFGNHAGYVLEVTGKPLDLDQRWAGAGCWSEANKGPGLIENNVFYSNLSDGFGDLDSGSVGALVIRDNWFVDNGTDGLLFRGMMDPSNDLDNIVSKQGSAQIGDITKVGTDGKYGSWGGGIMSMSWDDRTKPVKDIDDTGYIWQNAESGNQGWSFTALADTTPRTLCVLAGGDDAQTTLTAHLSDGSAPDYSSTQTYVGDGANLITLNYHASSPGQTLTITYVKSGNTPHHTSGSANLGAVWLTNSESVPAEALSASVTPTKGTYNLTALGTIDWKHWGWISYTGDRQLGAAHVTGNVFKDNAVAWCTAVEQHVLARPADMGIVIDGNTYDPGPSGHDAVVSWKPTNAARPITATGLAQMQDRLSVEKHGRVEHMAFRGPLIAVYDYPTRQDAVNPDPAKLHEVHSESAERLSIDKAIAKKGGAVGRIVTIPVFGHTPMIHTRSGYECEVYDLQARYLRLVCPNAGSERKLEQDVTPYATIAPTYLHVRLTRLSPYDVEAVFVR